MANTEERMQNQAEVIILPPPEKKETGFREFIGRCIIHGIDFYFEENDGLPRRVTPGIRGVRAIIMEAGQAAKNEAALESYRRKGARLYMLNSAIPDPWLNESTFYQIMFDARLTPESARFRRRMCARPDAVIFQQLGERMLQTSDIRWYDATRYNWEGLLDGYELTGDERFLQTASRQIGQAMRTEKNDLANCDRVAPLIPILRLYEMTGEQKLLRYSLAKFDRYIAVTPRYRGCFVNFCGMLHGVRSEILFQVCPGLMALARITGRQKYRAIALDQFEKLSRLLLCPRTGLWYHGRNDAGPTPAFWARGMAYGFLAMLQMIEQMEPGDHYRKIIKGIFRRMAGRIRDLQDKSGFWFTVVDRPDTEKESSGTAWVAAAMLRAMRLGHLDSSYQQCADAAWGAVKSRIWDGNFPGHATGTTVSPLPAYYSKKHLSPIGWTHFAFRAACERRRSQNR